MILCSFCSTEQTATAAEPLSSMDSLFQRMSPLPCQSTTSTITQTTGWTLRNLIQTGIHVSREKNFHRSVDGPFGRMLWVGVWHVQISRRNFGHATFPQNFSAIPVLKFDVNFDRFTAEEKAKRPQLCHMPFGFGPRSCIGMRLALLEAKIALIELLKRYTFIRAPETEVIW